MKLCVAVVVVVMTMTTTTNAQYACLATHFFVDNQCLAFATGAMATSVSKTQAVATCGALYNQHLLMPTTDKILTAVRARAHTANGSGAVYVSAYDVWQLGLGWNWLWPNGTVVPIPSVPTTNRSDTALLMDIATGAFQVVDASTPHDAFVVCHASAAIPCPAGFRYTLGPKGSSNCTRAVAPPAPVTNAAAAGAVCAAVNATVLAQYFRGAFGPDIPPASVWVGNASNASSMVGCSARPVFRTPPNGKGPLFMQDGSPVCSSSAVTIQWAFVACHELGFKHNYDGVLGPPVRIATNATVVAPAVHCSGWEARFRDCVTPPTFVRNGPCASRSQVVLNCTRNP